MSFAEDKGFNARILGCIDKTLQALGEGVQPALCHQIEVKYKLPRDQFVSKPMLIIEYLEEVLGPTGSALIERLIVREVGKEFNLKDERGNLPLATVIEDASPRSKDFVNALREFFGIFLYLGRSETGLLLEISNQNRFGYSRTIPLHCHVHAVENPRAELFIGQFSDDLWIAPL